MTEPYIYSTFLADSEEQQYQHIVDSVRHSGLCVLPQYFNEHFCRTAVRQIEQLLGSANCKVWSDALQADQRIMGIEALVAELDIFRHPLIYKVITSLYGSEELAGFIMAGKITAKPGNLGSGQGWHRDSVYDEQYKALLYLTDVDVQHGPFEYFLNTFSKRSLLATERCYGIGNQQNRLSEQEAGLLPRNRHRMFCAKAGTLIFANTRAIHRGRPIEQGERYALTTYSWLNGVPKHMRPFVNSL